ncbi:MAG: PAS domain-containing protein [Cyanobium sp.]
MAVQEPSGKGGGRRRDPIEPTMGSPSGSGPPSPNAANASDGDEVQLRLRRGRVVKVSDGISDLLGWRPEDWIGHGVEDFLHPEGLGGVDVRLAQLAPRQRVIWRDRLRSRYGRWHWVQLEVTPNGVGVGDGVDAVARPHELTAELIERADAAMDLAKRKGRNQVVAIAA